MDLEEGSLVNRIVSQKRFWASDNAYKNNQCIFKITTSPQGHLLKIGIIIDSLRQTDYVSRVSELFTLIIQDQREKKLYCLLTFTKVPGFPPIFFQIRLPVGHPTSPLFPIKQTLSYRNSLCLYITRLTIHGDLDAVCIRRRHSIVRDAHELLSLMPFDLHDVQKLSFIHTPSCKPTHKQNGSNVTSEPPGRTLKEQLSLTCSCC